MLKVIGGFVGKFFTGSGNAGGISVLVLLAAAGFFGFSYSNLRHDKKELKAEVEKKKTELADKETAWNAEFKTLEVKNGNLVKRIATDSTQYLDNVKSLQTTLRLLTNERNKARQEKDTCAVTMERVLDGALCREKNFWGKLTGKLVPCGK